MTSFTGTLRLSRIKFSMLQHVFVQKRHIVGRFASFSLYTPLTLFQIVIHYTHKNRSTNMLDTNFFWCPTNLLTAYDPPIKIDRIQVNAAILDFWLPGRVDWDLTNALLWYFIWSNMNRRKMRKTKHYFTKVDSILSLRTKNTSFMIISYQKRRVGCFSFSRD